ncbi:MAG: TraR/DksA C4-type zinc finger protein [Candidatus Wildermuthbacteria bacterium]|nr:TraR/DksA C4-type zinc finger protein [Candidatus Wildermuthbacteria bacterium]
MDKNTAQELKNKLIEEKNRLEKDLASFAKKDPNIKDNWRTEFPKSDKGEIETEVHSDDVEEYANSISVEFTLETQLKKVNEALARIEKEQYGKCEKCGKDIAIERLQASPSATFCEQCQ